MALGVCKPKGLTPFGWRMPAAGSDAIRPESPRRVKGSLLVAAVLLLLFLMLHLTGHGLGGPMHSHHIP